MKLCPKDLVLQFEDSDLLTVSACEGINMTIFPMDHANKLLRDEMSLWPVVYGETLPSGVMSKTWLEEGKITPNLSDTHRSRILPPVPIVKETAEDVLRDLVKMYEKYIPGTLNGPDGNPVPESILIRARKVLK